MQDKNEEFDLKETISTVSCIRIRYVQVALLFFLLMISFSIRVCLSVAIVAMTTNNTSSNPDIPTYDWDNTSIILSSFFWSYAILQFFAGHMAHLFGSKWLFFATMFVNALACVLIPVFAENLGANGVMACRIIQGIFQGFLLPLLNSILGRWAPPTETSLLNGIVFVGVQVGVIISMVITGYLSASPLGWPAAFYFFGTLGFIWCIFWLWLSADSPAKHASISQAERKYIEHSLGQQDDHLLETRTVPWKAIFKSLPYWAIIVAAIGESWGSTLLQSELPNYLSNAIGLNIKDSSLYSAAPTTVGIVWGLISAPLAGYIINKNYVTKANSRRIFHGYASFISAIGSFSLPYIENKAAIAVVLIVTSGTSSVACGHLVNHIDISPRYAGILAGISNGTGQFVAILAPILVHFIVTDGTDKTMWRIIFIIAGAIQIGTAIFFMVFCSGERQWWDETDKSNKKLSSDSTIDLPVCSKSSDNI